MGEKSAGAAYSRAPLVLSVSPQPTFIVERNHLTAEKRQIGWLKKRGAESEGPFLAAVVPAQLPLFEFLFNIIQTEILAPRWT
jgi:hypothetical protein